MFDIISRNESCYVILTLKITKAVNLSAISDTTACIVYNGEDDRNNFVYFKFKEVSMRIGIFTDTYFPQVSGVATSIRVLKEDLERQGSSFYYIRKELQPSFSR